MRTIDFSPMFRSSVGFDRMARLLDNSMAAAETANKPTFPPYNIEKLDDDRYQISMAVAGFSEEDIDITVHDGTLIITGKIQTVEEHEADNEKRQFLHRGIATRAFERRFDLADHLHVNGAELGNGLLHVSLLREVPEALKPRKIAIQQGSQETAKLESKAA